jgi:hypothetical protein
MNLADFAFGTASVGSRIDARKFEQLADLASAAGVTRFDCAPQYGRGLAMHFVARYLKARPHHPARITTKLGRMPVADAKSLAIVLAQGEWRQAIHLLRTPATCAADFSVENLTRSLVASRGVFPAERISHVFIHSSPSPVLHGQAGDFLRQECASRWIVGSAEPHADDLTWLDQERPGTWAVQVSAEQVLSQPALASFRGELWINSIIRYSRASGQSLRDTMLRLTEARPDRRIFVIGFNHARLFDTFAAI